ncbi:MAG TPA: oligosaccharide flippase family protein [Thermoanaerobaculaceae bacterium]|nr:oligosaccharide flippase family protein [Thermoanaerobaculaceae bacterium]
MSAQGDLGRKSVVLFTGTWVANGFGLLSTVLIARVLGPEAVGILGFSAGFVGFLSAFLLPGFAQAHQKRVAEGTDLGRCVGTMASLQLAIQGTALIVILLTSRWGSLVIPSGVPVSVVLFVLAAQLLTNLSASLSTAFVGREWAVAHASTQMAAKGLRFAATVAVLVWAPDIRWVAAALLVEGATAIAVGTYILIVRRSITVRGPDRATLASYWSYARPFLITSPIGMLQDSLDRILVARWAGLTAAGYYQVARVLWEILGTLNAYPFQLLLSRLSRLFAAPGGEAAAETRRVFASAVDRLLFIAVPAAFGLWALRQPIVALIYGERFLPAVDPLMVFVVAALAQAAFNPYQFVLYAMDQHARFVPVVLLRLVVYLLAMVALVPIWGGTGAATVRLLLVVFPCWVFIRWTRDLAGIGFQWLTAAYMAGFAVLVVVNEGTRRVLSLAGVAPPAAIASGMAVALAAYAGFLWLTHTGTRANLRYARELADPRRFVTFIRGSS